MRTLRLACGFTLCAGLIAGCGDPSALPVDNDVPDADASSTLPPAIDAAIDPAVDARTAAVDASYCENIPCLDELFRHCQPSGACVSSPTTSGPSYETDFCFANGVTQQSVLTIGAGIHQTITTKKDGEVCFVVDNLLPMAHDQYYYLFLDGHGNQVASGRRSLDTRQTYVSCVGGTEVLITDDCLGLGTQTNALCTQGACQP